MSQGLVATSSGCSHFARRRRPSRLRSWRPPSPWRARRWQPGPGRAAPETRGCGLAARYHRAPRCGRMRAGAGPARQPRGLADAGRGGCVGVGEGMFDVAVRGIVTAPGTVPGAGWLAIGGSCFRAVGWGAVAVAVPASSPTATCRDPLAVARLDAGRQPRRRLSRHGAGSSCPELPAAGRRLAQPDPPAGARARSPACWGALSLPLTAATVAGRLPAWWPGGDGAEPRSGASCWRSPSLPRFRSS